MGLTREGGGGGRALEAEAEGRGAAEDRRDGEPEWWRGKKGR